MTKGIPSTLTALTALALYIVMAQASVAAATSINPNHPLTTDFKPRFEFSIAAAALKAGATNLNYVIYNKALPLQSPNWNEREIRPALAPAFQLGARYFAAENQDVHIDWTHLDSTASTSVFAPSSLYFLGLDFEIGPDAGGIRKASGKVHFKYDVINLDAGQFVALGNHTGLRIFGGLSTGFLREQINGIYSGFVLTGLYAGPFNTHQQIAANFSGLGPRLGIAANYLADSGFGLMGEAAAAALIGAQYSKTSYVSTSQQLIQEYGQTYNYQTIHDQTIVEVIPAFDTKIGLSYQHAFAHGNKILLELGYEAAVYFNAINQYIPASLVAGANISTGGIYVATMSHTLSNYSVQGPFFRVTFNV